MASLEINGEIIGYPGKWQSLMRSLESGVAAENNQCQSMK